MRSNKEAAMNANRHAPKDVLKTHPCFSVEAHTKFGRMHLPVAPACNIQCKYCVRKYDCANESRPGITSRVLTPTEAVERVEAFVERNDRISVIGIAGPGDPLANEATFETLSALRWGFPHLTLCVSTNGLLLPERLTDLIRAGVKSLTVTINAVLPESAERIYSWVQYRGTRLTGQEAAKTLLANQWVGISNAIEMGLLVKVNSVYLPGVNDEDLVLVAKRAGELGADIMNVLPLIPQGEFSGLTRPSYAEINAKRDALRPFINQMSHCRQCRADACGTLGEDKDMELELLQSRIGEEYAESVL
jgi:nitrogen fixation protein NifB